MTLRWIEGFESRAHSDYFTRLYASYAGVTGDLATTGVRFGSAAQGSNCQWVTPVLVPAVENVWVINFALRKPTVAALGSTGGFTLRNSVGDQLSIFWVAAASPNVGAYRMEVRRGATVLATSTRVFLPGGVRSNWYFQFKATVRTGTNGAYELRAWDAEGTQITVIPSTTGVNTANQGTDGADRLFFATATGGTAPTALDHIVVMDGTGSVNNDLTSAPILVYGELPNADVAGEIDWVRSSGANSFSLVQDAANAPAGTGEVTSDVVGATDLYGFTQAELDLIPTTSPPAPLGIMVDVEGLMKNSGTRTLRVRFKDGASQADDAKDLVFSSTAKASRATVLEQNPTGTPAPWTVATLKTIELGPKLLS